MTDVQYDAKEEKPDASELSQETIHQLHAALVKCNLDPESIVRELPPALRASLPNATNNSDRLLSYLVELNRVRLRTGPRPLQTVLKTALALAPLQKEAETLERALSILTLNDPPHVHSQPHLVPELNLRKSLSPQSNRRRVIAILAATVTLPWLVIALIKLVLPQTHLGGPSVNTANVPTASVVQLVTTPSVVNVLPPNQSMPTAVTASAAPPELTIAPAGEGLLIDDVIVGYGNHHAKLDVRVRNPTGQVINLTRADLHVLSRVPLGSVYSESASYDLLLSGEHNQIPIAHVLNPGEVDRFSVRVGFTRSNTSCRFTAHLILQYNGKFAALSKELSFSSDFKPKGRPSDDDVWSP